MFFPLWIAVPVGIVLVLVVLYIALVTFLIVFAKYFARGSASGSDLVEQPIRREKLANFEPSRDAAFGTAQSRDTGLTRRTG